MQVLERAPKRPIQTKLLTVIQDRCLSQMIIREDKNLDLLFTSSPSPVNCVKGMPPIAKQIMTLSILSMALRLNGSSSPRVLGC